MLRFSILFLFIALASLVGLQSCQENHAGTPSSAASLASTPTPDVPKLLDRAEKLRNGTEWDHVQNFYGSQVADLRKDPQNYEARVKLAEVFIQEARVTGEHPHYYPAALNVLEPVIETLAKLSELNPKEKDLYFRALSHKASVQLSLHDFALARETAGKAVSINPYNAYIYGCLVDACVELGQYAKAVEHCDKMISIRPDLRSYARVSYLREIHGDVKGAMEAMDLAVKAGFPGYEQTEWARLQLGQLHERYGKLQTAEDYYKSCLAARPDYPFAIAALAGIEEKRGNHAASETLLKQALDIIPEVGFNVDLAKLYRKTGREEEARKLEAEIQTMMAEDIAAGHDMSLEAASFHLELTKDLDKALQFAQAEYQRRPDNNEVNHVMAEIYLARGDRKQAAAHLQKALSTKSKNPELAELKRQVKI